MHLKKRSFFSSLALTFVWVGVFGSLLFIWVMKAQAVTRTWDGGGADGTCGGGAGDGNKWSCALNWSGDVVPTGSDDVVFDGTSTKAATIDASFGGSINSISINSGYTGTITMSRSLSVAASFAQSAFATSSNFNGGSQSLTVGTTMNVRAGTFTAPSGGWTIAGNINVSNGGLGLTFNANGATLTTNGTTQSIGCDSSATFTKVVITNSSGTVTPGGGCIVQLGANPTINTTTRFAGTVSGTGTLTVNGNVFVDQSGSAISGFSAMTVSGSIDFSQATFNLSSMTNLTAGSFTMGANGGGTLTAPAAMTVTGNFSLSSATFTAPTGTLSIGGNLSNSGGTFTANSGTVNLNGTSQTISDAWVFYNFTKTVSSAATLTFPASTKVEIDGAMDLEGAAGQLLSLRSSSSGTQWQIAPRTSNRTINYLDVKDSLNMVPLQIEVSGHNITNSLNNTRWNFAGDPILAPLTVYTVAPFDSNVRTVDANTSGTTAITAITLTGKTVTKSNGLAYNPLTCTLYALLQLNAQTGRELVTLNPTTGVATNIGDTGKQFAGMAFDDQGILYGVTGDGETNLPETLYTINTSTAVPTLFLSLGNGDSGESIAYNMSDGYLYHMSGSLTEVFEKINLSTHVVTNIPTSGDSYFETAGMMWVPSRNYFLVSNSANIWTSFTTSGVATTYAQTFDPRGSKGIVPTSCTALSAPSAGGLGDSTVTTGGTISTTTPTLSFTLTDSDVGDTDKYQIQIDDSSDFSSPVVDYTSALATPGSLSFTVGQAAGSGTYTVGSGGQTLANGSYYWRVRGIDNHNLTGSYATANGGAVAFILGGGGSNTAPDASSNIGPSDLTNGSTISPNQPTFTFTLSDPNTSDSVRYEIQIDDTVNFSSLIVDYTSGLQSQGTATFQVGQAPGSGSYAIGTQGQTLSSGSYYWRVRTIDNSGAASGWTTANGGSPAFVIGGSAATSSPTPTPTSLTTTTTTETVLESPSPEPTAGGSAIVTAEEINASASANTPAILLTIENAINEFFSAIARGEDPPRLAIIDKILGESITLKEFVDNPTVKRASKEISAASIIIPPVLSVLIAAASVSPATSGAFYPLAQILAKILQAVGLLPHITPMGITFNTASGSSIPFVNILIHRHDKEETTDTVVTDEHGVYRGVKLPAGKYSIEAVHSDYSFPTVKPRFSLTPLFNFFKGEPFSITDENSEQFFMIPMDPKPQTIETSSKNKAPVLPLIISTILRTLFYPLALFSVILSLFFPSLVNFAITFVYIALFIIARLGIYDEPLIVGSVKDANGWPLAGTILRFIEQGTNNLKAIRVSKPDGSFSVRLTKGKYSLLPTKQQYTAMEGGFPSDFVYFEQTKKPQELPVTLTPISTFTRETEVPPPTAFTPPPLTAPALPGQ
ncbi:MAG TPA: hypothetical protein VLH19_03380 [Patescibacteria group bacterium]|nr:hypothetical protein [Patescibacteria group bacterium]